MIEKLRIKNVCSISEATMDFKKGKYEFLNENVLGDIVNPIAIYGHNGSGKSSFFSAINQFVALMSAPAGNLMPFVVNNFSFNDYQKNPTKENEGKIIGTIDFCFSLGKNHYEYSISTSRNSYISEEYLRKDQEIIFERHVDNYSFEGKKRAVAASSRLIATLRILASDEISNGTIQSVYAYLSSFTFANMIRVATGHFVTGKPLSNWGKMGDLMVEKSDEVKKYLKRNKDFPYYSVKKENVLTINPNGSALENYYIEMEDGDWRGTIPLALASDGMMSNTTLLSILLAVAKNSAIFIDELEVALHPSTIKAFLDVVREKKIQVIFSSHNTNILQDLRPDQVYFAKWSKGYSTIKRLSTIYPNIREVNNIEKMYMSRFFDEAIDGKQ